VRVVLMGGGTAGHLFPSVAVAQRLVSDYDAEVLFIGALGRLDEKILSEQALPHHLIPAQPFPYGFTPKTILALWALLRSSGQCLSILREFRPEVVFGAGGYVSVAGILAATRLGIPSVCHVSDAMPDRANRLLSRWATRITCHFEAAAAHFDPARTQVTGQPVRREFFQTDRARAREALGIPPEAFVLLVAGGSQGARTLNASTVAALPRLLADPQTCVVHLTGALEHERFSTQARELVGEEPRYHCLAFHERPWEPIAAADLALTRGGASSLAEMAVLGLPMIVVPYPFAAAHQALNARHLTEAGAALLVDNEELTPQRLGDEVERLRADPARLQAMREAAQKVSRPRAAEEIAALVARTAADRWGPAQR
jgi:UDP-N-acetylglucosamine--N-acetylmuramyl-(pentapeptide) pyrophosphoryl-undecaprenol N-acetylglucosamine transferase